MEDATCEIKGTLIAKSGGGAALRFPWKRWIFAGVFLLLVFNFYFLVEATPVEVPPGWKGKIFSILPGVGTVWDFSREERGPGTIGPFGRLLCYAAPEDVDASWSKISVHAVPPCIRVDEILSVAFAGKGVGDAQFFCAEMHTFLDEDSKARLFFLSLRLVLKWSKSEGNEAGPIPA
jgi:hypothetical protein